MELAKQLTPTEAHPGYDEKLAKYAQQKEELQAKATALEKQSRRYQKCCAARAASEPVLVASAVSDRNQRCERDHSQPGALAIRGRSNRSAGRDWLLDRCTFGALILAHTKSTRRDRGRSR